MIPVSPLMIGYLVQPKLSCTPALMFQGFTETDVSSAKHLWPAGSDWHRLCQLALSAVGLSAQQLGGFINTRWSGHIFASPPIIIRLLCVYVDLMAYSQWSCPLFILIRQFLEPGEEGESCLRAQLCLAKRTWLHRNRLWEGCGS